MITITLETRRAVVFVAYVAPAMLALLSWWLGRNYQDASLWLVIPAMVAIFLLWRVCFDMMMPDGPDDGEAGK